MIRENKIGERKPILVKVSPDLSNRQLADVVSLLMELNIDGIICSNTTIARENLKSDKLKREHRREGFETANADRIFESTFTSQIKN